MKRVREEITNYLKSTIRTIPDFPKPGIQFRDITTLLKDREALALTADMLVSPFIDLDIDVVVGIESRGFMFGPILSMDLNASFVPARKPGKLPAAAHKAEYELEYGTDAIEMHQDAFKPGANVIIHDDLLATGGTAKATCDLVERMGGKVIAYSFIIELEELKGRDLLDNLTPVHTVIKM